MAIESNKVQKNVYSSLQISPMMYDLIMALIDVKNITEVDSVYVNQDEQKFEIYVFYDIENFEIEDKIMKIFTNFEEEYRFFPEIFVYPLNLIEKKEMTLPEKAVEL